MSEPFQYFVVANKPQVSLEDCAQFGLSYAFDHDHQPVTSKVMHGPRPDGAPGVILCSSTNRIGYYPKRQTWRPMHGKPSVWVGMENDPTHRPTPEVLARDRQADGDFIMMRDRSQWLIPRARQYELFDNEVKWSETLPAVMDIDEQGEWTRGKVFDEYGELWRLANEYVDSNEVDLDRLFAVALESNYRVSLSEFVLLGIIETDNTTFKKVLDVVLDDVRARELLKKTLSLTDDTQSGSNGAEQQTQAELQDIAPPFQSLEPGQTVTTGA